MTEERKIQIPVVVDGSGSKAGFDEVKQGARDMAQAVTQAGVQASKGVDGIGVATEKLSASQGRIVESIKRQSIGLTEGKAGLLEYRAAQAGVADQAAPYIAKIKLAEQGTTQLGLSAKQTAFALRGVPAQFTDIITSLQGGQRPLQVLLQQGGQLKDMFGGIGPAARALGGYVLGLVNPFTIAAAVVGGLAFAAHRGSEELRSFQNAAILSGNAIGLSTSNYTQLRDSIADIAGTKGKAAEALNAIAASGMTAGQNVRGIAEAAILMEKATGQAISKTVDMFVKLADEPSKVAAELNKQYGFLTASVYAQIKALEEQGKRAEAAEKAETALAEALKSRAISVIENVGLMEKAWRGLAGAAKAGWDAMLNIGREKSLADRFADLSGSVAKGQGPFNPSAFGGNAEARAMLPENRAAMQSIFRQMEIEQRNTGVINETTAANKAAVSAIDAVTKANERSASKQEQLSKALKEYRENIEKIRAADPNSALLDPKKIAAAEAGIRKQFEDKAGINSAKRAAEQLSKATLGFDIEQIKASAEVAISAYAQSERALEAMRATGMVSEQEYYEGKRRLIDADSLARQDALEKEIARLQEEALAKKLSGADLVNNQKEVVKAQSKLAEERSNVVQKQTALSDKETQALEKVKRAYEEAAIAAASYIETLRRNAEREDMGLGIGDKARGELAGRFSIDDRFSADQERLNRELRSRAISQEQYDNYLALARFTYEQEVKAYEERTAKMEALSLDWAAGAKEALANYAAEAADINKQTEDAVTSAFGGMEDALVNFVTTGKLSFKDLANSIIADIARMVIKSQITGPLANMFTQALGSIGGGAAGAGSYASLGGGAGNYNFGGGFAKGGVFNSPSLSAYSGQVVNQPTLFAFARGAGLMGEAGPEAIMPLKRGPDGRLGVDGGGGGSVVVNQYITTTDTVSKSELEAKLRDSNRRMAAALDRSQRYGRG